MIRLLRLASVPLAAAAFLPAGGCNTIGGLVASLVTNDPNYIFQGLAADAANPTHTIESYKALRHELTPIRSEDQSFDSWTSWYDLNDRSPGEPTGAPASSGWRDIPAPTKHYTPASRREKSYTEQLQEIFRRSGLSIPTAANPDSSPRDASHGPSEQTW